MTLVPESSKLRPSGDGESASSAISTVIESPVQRVFGDDYWRARSAVQIAPQLSAHALHAVADDLKQSSAWQVLETARLVCEERLPANSAEWFGWLVALPQTELLDPLALCSASTLNALPNSGGASDANTLAEAVGPDMADWREPTALGFLNLVSTAQIKDTINEAGSGLAVDEFSALKKDALVVKAVSQLAVALLCALARIFQRTPVKARTALPFECSFIELSRLDRRAGNAESKLYRTG